MATLRDCYDKLIAKFVEFAVGLFPDNDDIKAALAQLTLAPMLMICFKVKQHLAPNFKDGKIDPKPLAEAFKIDVKAISEDNLKRLRVTSRICPQPSNLSPQYFNLNLLR